MSGDEVREMRKQATGKLESWGVERLTDAELLKVLLDEKGVEYADALLEKFDGDLFRMSTEPVKSLRNRAGIGLANARRIHAAVELGRRVGTEEARRIDFIRSSDDIVRLFRPELEKKTYEECWCLFLTSTGKILGKPLRMSIGGVQGTVVDQRIVMKRAVEELASQIVLVHNHPSGSVQPSEADKQLTDKIGQAAKLLNVRLLDHVIIARTGHFSFRQAGLVED